eukprot:983751-Lingulodinium_polyedra.AAC.1
MCHHANTAIVRARMHPGSGGLRVDAYRRVCPAADIKFNPPVRRCPGCSACGARPFLIRGRELARA